MKSIISSYEKIDTNSVIGQALLTKQSPEIESKFSGVLLDHFTADNTIRDRSEMMLAVDEGLGKIMETLEEQDILDNTFILFTSDNGYFYGEHGLSVERRLPYEESVRTPLLIRYPPLIEKKSKPEQFVLSIDYAPTALELAGASIGSHIQGQSILPLFQGETTDWRESFLIEYYSFENPMPWLINTDYKVLRKGPYKYIHWFKHENKNELYNLEEDPLEQVNLIREEGLKSLINDLENELAKEVARAFGLGN